MKQISIDLVAGGMVTAKPVADPRGNLLMKEGVALTDTAIEALRKRGVLTVWIHAEGDAPAKRSDADIRAELDAVFSEVIHDDLMLKIKAAAYNFLLRRHA